MNQYRSDKVGELAAALAKAQNSYKSLETNDYGPHGKFANLADTIDATRESLSKNGICFTQHENYLDTEEAIIETRISHESDQFMSSFAKVIPGVSRDTIRRRQAQMLLGIAPSPNDPDIIESKPVKETIKPVAEPKLVRSGIIDERQYQELLFELEGHSALLEDILTLEGIDSLAELPNSEYYRVLGKIRKIKKTEEEHIKKSR